MAEFPRLAQFKTPAALRARLAELGLELPLDGDILSAAEGSPLAQPLQVGRFTVGNRWCIHPMEGWDAGTDGLPSELTRRRWRNFGLSGAKFIWGGEAAAVRPDGRANPQQTLALRSTLPGLASLYQELTQTHQQSFGTADDLLVGLQLTHSGRFCRPHSKQLEPKIAYHHPLLDAKFGIDPADQSLVWTDEQLEELIADFVAAAQVAQEAGFAFVDIKACHGYLLHEFLSAHTRPGPFGGDYAGRTRLLLTIIQRIQQGVPGLAIAVRLSAFDSLPYVTSRLVGQPMESAHLLPYEFGFGVNRHNPLQRDLAEPIRLLQDLQKLGVIAVNISCGSPYYNPHLQRPASFPPSDGYLPPEDPLAGVVRQIQAARELKQAVPQLPLVGSGYSYLQDFLPQVAQAVIRAGWIDFVGLGRMVLSYPQLPADTLGSVNSDSTSDSPITGNSRWQRKKVCRTFSDCTTAPRQGLVSGCYPLDPYYKQSPAAAELAKLKQQAAD